MLAPSKIKYYVYNNIIKSIKIFLFKCYEMDTIFRKIKNSENSKTSNQYRLLLNLTDKIDWQKGKKCIALSILVSTIRGKKYKNLIQKQ